MAARTLQAYGTVRSLSPFTVSLDGPDATPVPARNYGLVLAVGQRVLLQLFPAPAPPLVVQPLTATPPHVGGGATVVNVSADPRAVVVVTAGFNLEDVLAANLAGDPYTVTGWSMLGGDPDVFTVDDTGITVDFDNYTGGSAVAIEFVMQAVTALTTDKFVTVMARSATAIVEANIPLVSWADPTVMAYGHDAWIAGISNVSPPAFPLDTFYIGVDDTSATASGSIIVVFFMRALVPGDAYASVEV